MDNITITSALIYSLLSEDIVSYILHGLSEKEELVALYKDTYSSLIDIYTSTLDTIDTHKEEMTKNGLLWFHVEAIQAMQKVL